MMSPVCTICGTRHDTTACPRQTMNSYPVTTPLPGSRSEEPDEDRVVTLRRQLLAARRDLRDLRGALDALTRYDGEGNPHARGIYVRHDDVQLAVRGEA